MSAHDFGPEYWERGRLAGEVAEARALLEDANQAQIALGRKMIRQGGCDEDEAIAIQTRLDEARETHTEAIKAYTALGQTTP